MQDVFLFLCLAAIYFIPTMIAWGGKNQLTTLIVNAAFGWTFVGWVVALIIAVQKTS